MRILNWLRRKAGMRYLEVEHTLDIAIEDKVVRLWIERDAVPTILSAYVELRAEIRARVMKMQIREFLEWLRTCTPGVTAAQLTRRIPGDQAAQVGVVCYYRPWHD